MAVAGVVAAEQRPQAFKDWASCRAGRAALRWAFQETAPLLSGMSRESAAIRAPLHGLPPAACKTLGPWVVITARLTRLPSTDWSSSGVRQIQIIITGRFAGLCPVAWSTWAHSRPSGSLVMPLVF